MPTTALRTMAGGDDRLGYGICPVCRKYVSTTPAGVLFDHDKDGTEKGDPPRPGSAKGDCYGGGQQAKEHYSRAVVIHAGKTGRLLRRYQVGGTPWLLVETAPGVQLSWPTGEAQVMARKAGMVAGVPLYLEEGVRYVASRPMSGGGQTDFPVTIRPKDGGQTTVVRGLSYEQANDLVNEFNNGAMSFDGRIWEGDGPTLHARTAGAQRMAWQGDKEKCPHCGSMDTAIDARDTGGWEEDGHCNSCGGEFHVSYGSSNDQGTVTKMARGRGAQRMANMGADKDVALQTAQANADRNGKPWRVGLFKGSWWIDQVPTWHEADPAAWAGQQEAQGATIVWPSGHRMAAFGAQRMAVRVGDPVRISAPYGGGTGVVEAVKDTGGGAVVVDVKMPNGEIKSLFEDDLVTMSASTTARKFGVVGRRAVGGRGARTMATAISRDSLRPGDELSFPQRGVTATVLWVDGDTVAIQWSSSGNKSETTIAKLVSQGAQKMSASLGRQ